MDIGSKSSPGTVLYSMMSSDGGSESLYDAILALKRLSADKAMAAVGKLTKLVSDLGVPVDMRSVEEAVNSKERAHALNQLFHKVMKLKAGQLVQLGPLTLRTRLLITSSIPPGPCCAGCCKKCRLAVTTENLPGFHLDHRDPHSKIANPSNCVHWSLEEAVIEWAKCDLLCAVCHASETSSKGQYALRKK